MKRTNFINKKISEQSGITLVALVVTIIVLLILAGVTIVTLTGDNGLLQKVTSAKEENEQAKEIYTDIMNKISDAGQALEELGVPREDSALVLPLGMETKIVCKHNMRNLIDMSRQRMCNRAYWEYREMFRDLCAALSEYSEQWAYIVKTQFMPKCEYIGYCPEKKGCGRMPGKSGKQ